MTSPVPAPDESHTGPAETWMTISGEQVHVATEIIRTGSVRLRRVVQTRTETVQVTLRREVLIIETDLEPSADGVYSANTPDVTAPALALDGLTPSTEPTVIVLREETPLISTLVRPYEQITARISQQTHRQIVTATAQHEEVDLGDLTGRLAP